MKREGTAVPENTAPSQSNRLPVNAGSPLVCLKRFLLPLPNLKLRQDLVQRLRLIEVHVL